MGCSSVAGNFVVDERFTAVLMAGEALAAFMFDMDAQPGRIIPPESVRDVGYGDPIAGCKVLQRFVQLIRARKYADADQK